MSTSSPYYITIEHAITYTNRDPLPVRDVIESLKGLQDLSTRFLPRTLTALSHEDIVGAELYVEGFEEGSFITQVLTRLFFRSEDDLMNFLAKINAGEYREAFSIAYKALPGGDKPVGKIATISVVLAVLVGLGAWYAAHDDKEGQVHIEANNNTVIAIGAEAYKMDPEAFAAIVQAAVGADKKKLAGDAARVLAPAKHDPEATVKIDGAQGLVFVPETIKATPTHPEFGRAEYEQSYPDVDLQIRATDRDSNKTGWRGVIPGLVDHRVKLILPESVPPDSLADKFSVRADVTVLFGKPSATGIHKPVAIIVERLVSDDDD